MAYVHHFYETQFFLHFFNELKSVVTRFSVPTELIHLTKRH
jgi:hypothetical protein